MNDKNNMLALSLERFSARKFTPEAVSQEFCQRGHYRQKCDRRSRG
jgi:hypothetical protein